MTNLNPHVTFLDLSRRLAELGVKKESCFSWLQSIYSDNQWYVNDSERLKGNRTPGIVPAYLASELGEMLPHKAFGDYLRCFKGTDEWICAYGIEKTIYANTMPDAMAKMLICLLEQGLLNPKEL